LYVPKRLLEQINGRYPHQCYSKLIVTVLDKDWKRHVEHLLPGIILSQVAT
jgi:hypothetical protein